MKRTESKEISAVELIGAVSDTTPTYNGFGPLLELSAGDYSIRTAVKLPNDWNGGTVKVRINHARQDSDTVAAGIVINLIEPGTETGVGDAGTPVSLDLSGPTNKLTTSPAVDVTPGGTYTGSEFLGIYITVPEPSINFRDFVRSIEIQYTRELCEDAW